MCVLNPCVLHEDLLKVVQWLQKTEMLSFVLTLSTGSINLIPAMISENEQIFYVHCETLFK